MNISMPQTLTLILILLNLLFAKSSSIDPYFIACNKPQNCGDNQPINFPFYIQNQQQSYCGFPGFKLSCNSNGNPFLQLSNNDYIIHQIFYKNHSIRVSNTAFFDPKKDCPIPQLAHNLSLPDDRFKLGSGMTDLFFLFGCTSSIVNSLADYKFDCVSNKNGSVLALLSDDSEFGYATRNCHNGVAAPVEVIVGGGNGVEEMMKRGFLLDWTASNCSVCEQSGGKCGFNESTYHFQCYCPDRPHAKHCISEKSGLALKLGAGIGGPAILIAFCLGLYFIRRRYKQKYDSFLSRYTSSDRSKSDLEGGSVCCGVSIFSYSELEEATNNFAHDKELGDGGFGTVYYGKLKDGREVAVKRLYENNYRRVEQFMNEVEILTRLRHKNLVLLYGCTSRRSRELLLVYEYIPNGTVADHLHGDRAEAGSLTWPTRMNIAVETASALVYLHASEIIHRDVKTNNILLDDNFSVKVADFGLSRLFPSDVTHVSTAPQGTPGYVDPEYHQCYQLTVKSDVYSFGVVLVELISSMPAVDISRHRHEINLSNLAINKIQKGAFNELVDPRLGFESDETVRMMTIAVAELAFKCLQHDKDMRPYMDEVLDALKKIESESHEEENLQAAGDDAGVLMSVLPPPSPDDDAGVLMSVLPPPSPDCDEVVLLKNMRPPPSPDSVTDTWISSSSVNS